MYIFGIILLLTIAAGIVMCKASSDSGWHLAATLGGAMGAIGLLGACISIPVSRAVARGQLVRMEAFRTTVRAARADKSLSEVERAAILKSITDWNSWLAAENYWHDSQWAWWNLDLSGVEPLR